MKKISLSLLIIILLISVACPVLANQTIISDNPDGKNVEEINYPEKMVNNYGTVTLINDSGNIENNHGIVITTHGSVSNNYGTVGTIYPNGSVSINDGVIEENNYYVNVNNPLGVIKTNNYRVQMNQYGLIETNNSEVWSNYGSILLNNPRGYVDDNYGTIENNKGTVLKNKYTSDNTSSNIVNNTENGTVLENYANVTGGTIEKNYSKDVRNTTIYNNFSSEVGENVTIKRNFASFINNANIENQYYKLTIEGNANFVCAVDSNNNLEDNIYIDQEGQTWIKAEDAMYTITAKENYRIVGTPTIIAGGTTIVSQEDARNIGFSGINGEITIRVETEDWINYPIEEGNEFTIDKSIHEDLTITVDNGNDSVVKVQYKKLSDDEYKQAIIGFSSQGLENGKERFVFNKAFLGKLENTKYQLEFVSKHGISIATVEIDEKDISGGMEEGIVDSEPETTPSQTTEPSQEAKTNNPQTGNSITIWLLTLLIACVGLIVTRKNKKI